MSAPLHIAFLGCGFITDVHSRQLKVLGGATVRSYASRDKAKAESYCARLGGIGSYASYEAAIEDPKVEAIVVATPPSFHLDLTVRALAAKGIKNTGNAQRIHRNGPVVTAGGLIFVGTNPDATVWAFDKDTGKILWERQLDANPEGMAAVFEIDGRQYIAFCASYYPDASPGNISIYPGKAEAQGYYVFALPQRETSTPRRRADLKVCAT